MKGRRLLVVGASSGIGREVALAAARAGYRVMAAARRADRLAELREEQGSVEIAVADVRRDADCAAMVERAVECFGGLDAFVYATGTSPLGPLADTDGEAWRAVLETNLVGAAQVCRAALPQLRANGGRAVFLSSLSADDPRPFMVAYGASKAGLEAMVRGWRNEHPELCFLCLVVGPTATEFGSRWDPAALAQLQAARSERGLVKATSMTPAEVAGEVLHALDSPVWTEHVTLVPRNAPD